MLRKIFFWLTKSRDAQELAVHAEAMARDLNNLPTDSPEISQPDIISVLQSTCALLERLVEQRQGIASQHDPSSESAKEIVPEKPELQKSPPLIPPPGREVALSHTAKELIKLSDWVLLAKAGGTAVQPAVLEEIYRQLTGVLAKEGVTLLEAQGPCDYERQMVVGTHPTDDPAQDEHVYSTVRPGYLFHEQLIRPQEVIIYVS